MSNVPPQSSIPQAEQQSLNTSTQSTKSLFQRSARVAPRLTSISDNLLATGISLLLAFLIQIFCPIQHQDMVEIVATLVTVVLLWISTRIFSLLASQRKTVVFGLIIVAVLAGGFFYVVCSPKRAAVYFVVDATDTMQGLIQGLGPQINVMARGVPEGYDLGLLAFGAGISGSRGCSDVAQLVAPAPKHSSVPEIASAVGELTALHPQGPWNLKEALIQALDGLEGRSGVQKIIIVTSSGDLICGDVDPSDIREAARDRGLTVEFSAVEVAPQNEQGQNVLKRLVGEDHYIPVQKAQDVPQAVEDLVNPGNGEIPTASPSTMSAITSTSTPSPTSTVTPTVTITPENAVPPPTISSSNEAQDSPSTTSESESPVSDPVPTVVTISVPANVESGISTGVHVEVGTIVDIVSTGQWCWGLADACSSANGTPGRPTGEELGTATLNGEPFGKLIGKINDQLYPIGEGAKLSVQTAGDLMLLMNDRQESYTDNSGSISVTIRVTRSASNEETPAPSAESQSDSLDSSSEIAFYSSRSGDDEIHVMNSDGTNVRQLTNAKGTDAPRSFSSDGNLFAFASRRDSNWEIYIMSPDGSNQRNLSNSPRTAEYDPYLSPNGESIAFTSDRDGNPEIYVMNIDGTNVKRLTNNSSTERVRGWSPDGSMLVYDSDQYGDSDILVMNIDEKNQRVISNYTSYEYGATWSPDGKSLAFIAYEGDADIFIIDLDGNNRRNITNSPGFDGFPSWSSDGNFITFTSDRDGNNEIYVMRADGTDQQRITNDAAFDSESIWRPK